MQKRQSIIVSLAWALCVGGCGDSSPLGLREIVPGPTRLSHFQYSDGFYPDPEIPGHYIWDGQPPPGDLTGAEIISAVTHSKAPELTPGGVMTSGWVSANVEYSGDVSRIELVYNVSKYGTPIYLNAVALQDWKWGPNLGRTQLERLEHNLYMSDYCNVDVSAGGTASAALALPFRITLNLLKPKWPGLALGTTRWGETNVPMGASSDAGPPCPDWSPCDDPRTEEIERCPPEADPLPSPQSSEGGFEDKQTDIANESYMVRCWYVDRWWGSVYLGRTWLYCEPL